MSSRVIRPTPRPWRDGRLAPNWSFHFGLVLAGWGLFDLIEGTANHHLLGIHQVGDDAGAPLAWDLGFLLFGALLVLGGWWLHRRGAETTARERRAVPMARR